MKKITKLSLFMLCAWVLLLWFGSAQSDWFSNWGTHDIYVPYENEWRCTALCEISFLWLFAKRLLILIWVILWMMLIGLTINTITFHKKFNDIQKNTCLAYIPILNLYHVSKITIWRMRFFFIILLIWFFIYSICRNINYNRCCFHNPSRHDYTGIIVWILSIVILSILVSKLHKFYKKTSNE